MKAFVYLLLFITFTSSNSLTGKVVRVVDGDTIIVLLNGNKQERIRLLNIDAPEKGQDYSAKSTQFLSDLIAGKTVRVEYKSRDQYKRILGTVFIDDINVNEEIVKNGLAWNYYYSKDKRLISLQEEAQKNKLNIFSMKNPINPYHWRKGIRK